MFKDKHSRPVFYSDCSENKYYKPQNVHNKIFKFKRCYIFLVFASYIGVVKNKKFCEEVCVDFKSKSHDKKQKKRHAFVWYGPYPR